MAEIQHITELQALWNDKAKWTAESLKCAFPESYLQSLFLAAYERAQAVGSNYIYSHSDFINIYNAIRYNYNPLFIVSKKRLMELIYNTVECLIDPAKYNETRSIYFTGAEYLTKLRLEYNTATLEEKWYVNGQLYQTLVNETISEGIMHQRASLNKTNVLFALNYETWYDKTHLSDITFKFDLQFILFHFRVLSLFSGIIAKPMGSPFSSGVSWVSQAKYDELQAIRENLSYCVEYPFINPENITNGTWSSCYKNGQIETSNYNGSESVSMTGYFSHNTGLLDSGWDVVIEDYNAENPPNWVNGIPFSEALRNTVKGNDAFSLFLSDLHNHPVTAITEPQRLGTVMTWSTTADISQLRFSGGISRVSSSWSNSWQEPTGYDENWNPTGYTTYTSSGTKEAATITYSAGVSYNCAVNRKEVLETLRNDTTSFKRQYINITTIDNSVQGTPWIYTFSALPLIDLSSEATKYSGYVRDYDVYKFEINTGDTFDNFVLANLSESMSWPVNFADESESKTAGFEYSVQKQYMRYFISSPDFLFS